MDGLTDLTTFIDAFRNFAKTPNNVWNYFNMQQNNVIKEGILILIILDKFLYDRFSYVLCFHRWSKIFVVTDLNMTASCKQL